MKRYFNLVLILFAFSLSSCYDDYIKDFEKSYVYFASQKPLRKMVADTDMSIKVGVGIAGKREVNTSDWATFHLDESLLLPYPALHMMPADYYTLTDAQKMTISNPNLAIADVKVDFTEKFYNDPLAVGNYYALPFRIKEHSLQEIGKNNAGELRDFSIVVVKYVSKYHGTYYVRGKKTNLTTDEVTNYNNNNLSQNITRDFSSLGRFKVTCLCSDLDGGGNMAINLTINDNGSVTIEQGRTVPITNATAVLDPESESLSFSGKQPKFTLSYIYELSGVQYRVEEELIRRQDPKDDLRFEEWQ